MSEINWTKELLAECRNEKKVPFGRMSYEAQVAMMKNEPHCEILNNSGRWERKAGDFPFRFISIFEYRLSPEWTPKELKEAGNDEITRQVCDGLLGTGDGKTASDTPRTDEAEARLVGQQAPMWFSGMRDLSRTLERENAQLQMELESHIWKISPEMAQTKIDRLNAENEKLKKRLAEEQANVDRLTVENNEMMDVQIELQEQLDKEKLERENAERELQAAINEVESMARQHCHTGNNVYHENEEKNITDSGALSADADALLFLAKHGRFAISRSDGGRMVLGYWPEHDPKTSAGDAETVKYFQGYPLRVE